MSTQGFPSGIVVKNPPVNAGDLRNVGLISGLRRPPGVGNGNPLQYFCLGNAMERGACWAIVHGSQGVRHNLMIKQQEQQRVAHPISSTQQFQNCDLTYVAMPGIFVKHS